MQLYYASSDFFRNLAGIQDIEKLEKKASLGLNHGSALYKQGTLGRFGFFWVLFCLFDSLQTLVYTSVNWRKFLAAQDV